jgi:glycerol kinase
VSAAELAVDGGASQNDWLMQFQADVLGVRVRRPAMVETTALGAAGLAGIGVGVWRDAAEFLAAGDEPDLFEPSGDRTRRAELLAGWRRAVAATLAWSRAAGTGD